jgi:predicted phage-related endonuclease
MGLTLKQLATRRTGVSATDVRAIVGLDPYGKSAHDVWASKCLDADEQEESERFELADAIELILVKRLAKARGLTVIRKARSDMTVVHRERPTRLATPDAFFLHDDGGPLDSIGEVKVVSPFQAEGWGKSETTIPDWCVVQVAWQMHVVEVPRVHVGALIWPGVRTYTVERDLELEGLLVEEADRFWQDHVLAKKPPPVDGTEGSRRMLARLFPKSNGARFKASPQVEELARDYFDTKKDLTHAEQLHEQAKQLLILAAGETDGIDGDGWRLHHKLRNAYDATPSPYHVEAKRHFDMRATSKGAR